VSIELVSSVLSLEKILEEISGIALQIQQCRELEDILQEAIADARTLLQTDRVLIYRFLQDQDAVVAFESVDPEWTPVLGQFIPSPCINTTWVERYRQGQATAISDTSDETIDPSYVQTLERLQIQAHLVVPIFNQDTLWALLIVHHHCPRQWQPLEIQLLQQIALPLGIAVQQAELRQRQYPEIALQESEQRFRVLSQSAPVGIFLTDVAGNCTYVNDCWCQLTQLTIDQAADKGWQQAIHPHDRLLVFAKWSAAVQEGREFDLEYRFLRPDGLTVWVTGRATTLKTPDGDVSGFIGTVSDISAAKRDEVVCKHLELQLQASEEKLSDVLENVNASVISFRMFANRDWEYDYISSGCETLFGYPPQDFKLNKMLWVSRVFPEDQERVIQNISDTVFAAGTCSLEYRFCHANGGIRWISESLSSRWSESAACWMVTLVSTDISERKQKEELIQNIAQGVSAKTGEAFFHSLVQYLIRLLDMDQALVGELIASENPRVKIIAGLGNGQLLDGLEYSLLGTPSEQVVRQGFCIYPDQIQQHFPNDSALRNLGSEGYAGIPLVNSSGAVLGLIGVLNNQAIANVQFIQEVLTIFAVRATSELERQQSEALLRRYERLVATIPNCVALIDRNYCYQVINQTYLAWNQKSYDEIVGHSVSDLLGQEFFEIASKPFLDRCLAGETQHIVEAWLNHRDGQRRYIRATYVPYVELDGTISGVVVNVHDLTKLKQTELALQWQSEQRWLLMTIAQHIRQTLDLDHILNTTVTEVRQFLQTDRAIVYQFDSDWSGKVIAESVAEGWRSLLGVQVTDTCFVEMHGKAYEQGRIEVTEDIYSANFSPCHIELLEQMQVRAKLIVPILQENHLWGLLIVQDCQMPRQWTSSEIGLLQQLATQIAIAIQQSQLYQQVQTLNTSLELQVQERTLQLQKALDFEALLKRITDHVRDSLDESQILQTVVTELAQGLSIAACDTGIYNTEQTTFTIAYEFTNTLIPVRGHTFEIATAPNADIYPQLLSGQICHFCNTFPHPFYSDQPLLTILAVPIVDDQGILGDLWLLKPPDQIFDAQEVRLAQQVANQCAIALRQSRLYQAAQVQVKELEQLNHLKDDFLSTVSHELRSPMSNIKMATQMLEINLTRLGILDDKSSPISRYFNILKEESKREINLINDLLDLARLDAKTEPLNLITIALQFYIPHLAETFIERTHQQQQRLIISVPRDLPSFTTDRSFLERILTELLHNACKYTPAGETIAVSAQFAAKEFEIRVSNSGVEIPVMESDRIFDKFYRIPNNDPWKHGGTGLGLALVKKLTERLGGDISVESSSGQTTFLLKFTTSIELL
jgi:PAS domain S-box-containing protein